MNKMQLTDEEIIAIAKRHQGEIWITWHYRNNTLRNRLRRMVKRGLFRRAPYHPGTDGFILNT